MMEWNSMIHPSEIGKSLGLQPPPQEPSPEATDSPSTFIQSFNSFLNIFAPCHDDSVAALDRLLQLENFLEYRRVSLKITAASMYMPKRNPEKPRGEDAHFISLEKQTIGVADGVGGWAMKGIDGGEYARQLMANSFTALQNEPTGSVNPKRVLQEAYSNTTVQGSSTACIITLSGDKLHAANVGDSGFLVIRDGALLYRSRSQQRKFNCPYQLGTERDNPSVADEIEVAVKKGDIVVAATDGLLDNVHESEIVKNVGNPPIRDGRLPEQAFSLARLALYYSFHQYTETPFSMAARAAGMYYRGGKPDDITVIIARVDEV